jgi:hypothetical protein
LSDPRCVSAWHNGDPLRSLIRSLSRLDLLATVVIFHLRVVFHNGTEASKA